MNQNTKSLSESYYRANYYHPVTGRFSAEDSIGFNSSEPNLYPYVWNNSTNLIDSLGLWPGSGLYRRIANNIQQTVGLGRDVGQFWWQYAWGAFDMWNNYEQMQQRNWIDDDKYYHCMANCMATRRGLGGHFAAVTISFVRTNLLGRLTEPDWRDDDKANT